MMITGIVFEVWNKTCSSTSLKKTISQKSMKVFKYYVTGIIERSNIRPINSKMGQKIRMKNVSYAKNVLETDQKKLEKPYNMPLIKDL